MFTNNVASKNGNDLLSYPTNLLFMTSSGTLCSDTTATCEIANLKSGDKYNSTIEFFVAMSDLSVVDLTDLYQSSDVTDFTATLSSNDNVDVSGKGTVQYSTTTQSFVFSEVVFTSYPNTV